MHKIYRYTLLLFILAAPVSSQAQGIKPGIWQGVLQRPDGQKIIFNFESATLKGKPVWYVINAGERLLVDAIRQRGDSLWIRMPFFASGFALQVQKNGNLKGLYIKNYGVRKEEIPFYAAHNVTERYPRTQPPAADISGRWAATFNSGNGKTQQAIGEFVQEAGGRVTGTFLTPSGDYRYLEGSVSGDSLHLSGFDGGHAFVFTALLNDKDSISKAAVYSGLKATQSWTARRNDTVQLPDENTYTKLREGESRLNFRFRSTSGEWVSIDDPRYKNKVVIVQILGSWCPNCMDETAYLSDFYARNKARGVEIIGLAYERTGDFEASRKALIPFQKRYNVKYPFLVTGVAVSDEQRTEKTLPQLESIKAFPTSIVIDKKGNVRKVHSGFNGPGTGKHYEEFKKEFESFIDGLLNEPS
ncbi:peroxiredoxin family protein [Niabella drilacis]|uniref:Peroxiredoxin n=1 Tax=Niabella drilacis (strain DSM 25811 / CCM 8410 / CCUG 62505 / LMG 26954 / E90) TaxID=1285928 RepID=A0A1G7BD30_NIADE|nr:TlpA disulfide reductase family protein [Niabella drilacis]SDE24857.1 Peroxiredoxin [Niabella drilacis]